MNLASLSPQAALPSPSTAVWQLGPVPIRAYALCIVLGIVVAAVVTDFRLRRRGVAPWAVLDIAVWAVPFGIVGARIYHVITSPENYFGAGGEPIKALYIWEGGLGIWGAVAGGAVGAWLAARQLGIPLSVVADALAPGLPLAQAIGRLGNWFNNELYGGPTTLPWGLEIHQMEAGRAVLDPAGQPVLEPGLYHPTFAYEALWNIGVALLVFVVDRRLKLGRGRAFALYVMGYTAGRFWIEMMRTDQANEILGLRVNVWTAGLVFLGALVYFIRVRGPREYLIPVAPPAAPGPETPKGDISQVDVSRRVEAAPVHAGYRVVTEEQFQVYRETGELSTVPDPIDTASDRAAPDTDRGDATSDEVDTTSDRVDSAPAGVDRDTDSADNTDRDR
ncbi:prolipoprotein diacylglyceryl transferase [Micromonospora sonneratiae]|uniref:Phosphatidylglycerol--prolipoprotein diacylglyceryl transferase n=1 Tax=Micromonospora sonneratiae TaxID=1184706 RepID=A0ABW3YL58_9ACTN